MMDSSLTKFELNNQIVLMRHNVKRAKVQTVAKLVRKVRMLRNKKAPDILKKKNEEKAKKLVNELLVMKKIPGDEISAFSLSNSKDADSILKDVNSSARLRSLARLSLHKSIAPVVQLFHCKYPAWEKEVPKVLIALKTGRKLTVKDGEASSTQKDKKQNKASKKDNDKQKDTVKMSSDDESEGITDSDDLDNSSGSEADNSEGNSEESFIMSKGNRFSISSDDAEHSLNLSPNKVKIKGSHKAKKKSAGEKTESDLDFDDECETVLNEDSNSDNNIMEDDVSAINSPKVRDNNEGKKISEFTEKIDSNSTPMKNIDPFFIGSDDKEYETSNPIVNPYDREIYNDDSNSFIRKLSNSDFKNKHNFKMVYNSNKEGDRQFKHNFNWNHSRKQNDFKNEKFKMDDRNRNDDKRFGGARVNRGNIQSTIQKPENLHPSWEAKKKISSIVPFTGKKIVF